MTKKEKERFKYIFVWRVNPYANIPMNGHMNYYRWCQRFVDKLLPKGRKTESMIKFKRKFHRKIGY